MTASSLRAASPPVAARVLIVDDSAVTRAVLGRIIDASDRFTVAGGVSHVEGALAFLARASVDIILLDVFLPGIDGVTAIPDLLAVGGTAKVLVVSSSVGVDAGTTARALAFGAAGTMAKPATGDLSARFGVALLDRLERLGAPVSATAPAVAPNPAPPCTAPRNGYDVVAIGASTGGIHALSLILRQLPAGFRVPVLVTQHLPATFMPYFAAQLAVLAGRPCEVATDRMRVRPGRLIVAPGDAHMRCVPAGQGACIRLSREKSASGCMPSVDPMLASIAATYKERALGIVLSGMGRDGADGARAVRDAGGAVVVQDEASSVIWGMPGAVVQAGAAAAMLPPAEIGRLVAEGRRP